MTSMPRASTAVTASSTESSDRLRAERNTGSCHAKNAQIAASAISIDNSRVAMPIHAARSVAAHRGGQQSLLGRFRPARTCRRCGLRTASRCGRSCPSVRRARSRRARRLSGRRQPVDELVDLELRADVDAARRLVEQQDLRLRQQRLAEHDLLLVAAGKRADRLLEARRLDAQFLDDRLRVPGLRRSRSTNSAAAQAAAATTATR